MDNAEETKAVFFMNQKRDWMANDGIKLQVFSEAAKKPRGIYPGFNVILIDQ